MFAVGLALSASAQNLSSTYDFGRKAEKVFKGTNVEYRPDLSQNQDRALVELWSEDFTDTTVNGGWSLVDADGSYWGISNAVAAPNGYGMSMVGDYLLWNSYDPVSVIEDLDNTPENFASTSVYGTIETPAIDLSSTNAALLEFDFNGMYCCFNEEEPWHLSFSTDGGSNWSALVPLDLGLGVNEVSNSVASPIKFSLIISDYLDMTAANNDDVKIRFTWKGDSPTSGFNQYSSHYYWGVDNISIYELPDYDIKSENLWLADVIQNDEYTQLAISQAGQLVTQSKIQNFGGLTPANLTSEVVIYAEADLNTPVLGPANGGALLNGTIASGNIDTLTFETGLDLSTLSVGRYKVRSVITHDNVDDNTANDTLWRTIEMTNDILSHVDLDADTSSTRIEFDHDTKVGARFNITQNVDLHGFDVFLQQTGNQAGSTTLDGEMIVTIEESDGAGGASYIDEFTYTLNSAKMDNWYTFILSLSEDTDEHADAPIALEAGKSYFITVSVIGGNELFYRSNSKDYDFTGRLFAQDQSGTYRWFWTGDEPWMRLNFNSVLDVTEENVLLPNNKITQYPNPFNDVSTVSYSLNGEANVNIMVTDLAGKVVANYNEGTKSAGKHSFVFDANNFVNGTYLYTINAGGKTSTHKMVVNK